MSKIQVSIGNGKMSLNLEFNLKKEQLLLQVTEKLKTSNYI